MSQETCLETFLPQKHFPNLNLMISINLKTLNTKPYTLYPTPYKPYILNPKP